jgi:hypothetical protein
MPDKIKKMKPKRAAEDSSNSIKIAWIVGAVGLCILLVAGIAIATGGGSGKKKPSGIMAQGETTTPSTTPTTAPSATSKLTIEQVQVPPLSIYRRRNPFEPLVNLESPSSTAGTTPGVGGSRTVTVPPELRTGPNPAPETSSSALTLDGIFKQGDRLVARIRVGDQVFDSVPVGGTFGDHYKLLTVAGDSSATILFGDERFTIFTGQSIYP